MQVFNTIRKVIVTSNYRLTPYLEEEIKALGFEIKRTFKTGVELLATANDCITLNLHLRCANQVLYEIRSFKAETADDLYKTVKSIPWEEWIPMEGYFSIYSNVKNDTIRTPLFANVKVKDAIADRFMDLYERRPNSGSSQDKTVICLHWQDKEAELFLDTSGETLAKHGYRKIPGKAPMQEGLAASVVLASGWDQVSPFVNPMCGSGTLAIEAALIASNRKPGLLRLNYAFMHLIGYDEQVFYAERRKLKDLIKKDIPFRIIASDVSEDAVEISKVNAKAAGVDQLIDFEQGDFSKTTIPEGNGTILFNPEYGQRLGEHHHLELVYKRMGDFLKQSCKGYKGFIFTGNPDLAKKIGLKPFRKIEFFNGKLDCRLLCYEMYEGTKRIDQLPQ